MDTIGQRIRAVRTRQGISRKQLADYAGIAESTLSDLELDRSKATTKLHLIAERLGTNANWLQTGKGPRDGSQVSRFDDATMTQAVELLYLMADARPEDRRFRRLNWAMILIAANGIQKAEGDPRKAMANILADLAKEA